MYADMLLAEGHPAEALTQYKFALKLSPNRFDGAAFSPTGSRTD
jgi:hypothetical protein